MLCLGLDSLYLSTQSTIWLFMHLLVMRKYLTVFSISSPSFSLVSPSGMLMDIGQISLILALVSLNFFHIFIMSSSFFFSLYLKLCLVCLLLLLLLRLSLIMSSN